MPKNFVPNTSLYFGEAFEIPKDFSRKVLCVGVWGRQPQHSIRAKKHGATVLFYLSKHVGTAVPNLRFKVLFCKKLLKNPQKLSFTKNNSNKNTIKDKIYIDFSENI